MKKECVKKITIISIIIIMKLSLIPLSVSAEWKNDSYGWKYKGRNSYYASGWAQINGYWYCFDNDGYMKNSEWQYSENGYWYYLGANGECVRDSWLKLDGYWYYFDENGFNIQNQWKMIDEKCYYFDGEGKMICSCN